MNLSDITRIIDCLPKETNVDYCDIITSNGSRYTYTRPKIDHDLTETDEFDLDHINKLNKGDE